LKTIFYLGITIITIGTLYTGYVYINDWFTYPNVSNNIDPKGKGPQIQVESPNGSINTINKSIVTKLGDVLLFNRVRNITDAATYLRDRYLPYMDVQVVDEIQINNPYSQKLHQFYPYTTYRPGETFFNRLKCVLMKETPIQYELRMNDIKICNGTDLVSLDQDFIQGSSKDISLTDIRKDCGACGTAQPAPSSPMYKGYGINPKAPPVPNLDNDSLSRISYQYGIPQPSASPILKSSSMINPDSFMSRVEAAATQIKLDSIPTTPNIPPLSLSSDCVR
jgi:hypothetical protein